MSGQPIMITGIWANVVMIILLVGAVTCANCVFEATRELWREFKRWRAAQ